MAKLNAKAPKQAGKTEQKDNKLNSKSVAIKKPEKKTKTEKPVKNLKNLAKKEQRTTPKPKQNQSPKKEKNQKAKKGKFEKKTGTIATIGPNKKAKTLPKGPKPGKTTPQAVNGELVSKDDIGKSLEAFRAALKLAMADKKAQLDPDFKYILQLCCFKIPQCPERIART